MYADPSTLTDKQKKDTKFMFEVCTEMTPEIMAKAAQSLSNNVLNKYRVVRYLVIQERKNKLEGKDEPAEEKKGAKKEPKK
jgi:ABC-type transporter lipoprotein component MlaA